MKNKIPVKLMNIKTREVWHCENPKEVKVIEGVEFVSVQKEPAGRSFFMRLDQFTKIK